jgi:short subunit dehydrogenase-like uncharacterized protein
MNEHRRDGSFLLYGASGFTGELAAREAVRRGLRPILAGRRNERVEPLAQELGLPHRAVALTDRAALEATVAETAAVLHCAGPFVRTSRPMVEACLTTGTHYLDITGEIAVFEALRRKDEKARGAGIALLPGAGFDVVPSDCLAARLAEALPGATTLELAFAGDGARWSAGTLKTLVESLPALGAVRHGGRIVPVGPAHETREIDFPGLGCRFTMTIPWGDIATAHATTGIPDIKVFTAVPRGTARRVARLKPLLPLSGLTPVKRLLQAWIGRKVENPGAEVRERARIYLWGRVLDAQGRSVEGSLVTPEGYSFTAVAAVEATRRVVAGQVAAGYWTPSRAFGASFVEGLPGLEEIRITLREGAPPPAL